MLRWNKQNLNYKNFIARAAVIIRFRSLSCMSSSTTRDGVKQPNNVGENNPSTTKNSAKIYMNISKQSSMAILKSQICYSEYSICSCFY